ncbi:hypothetical protein [Halobacteriovorax sp. RT-2-6]|uniref:tellurite resistance TerB family protein n=1 Tax=unclassified Halobacteriovorax TaxID=2639665 RepID=UPI00399A39AF
MNKVDPYVAIWSILNYFYVSDTRSPNIKDSSYVHTLEKWSLGDGEYRLRFFEASEKNNLTEQEAINNCIDISENIDALLLGILYEDLNEILSKVPVFGQSFMKILKIHWEHKIEDPDNFLEYNYDSRSFVPKNSLAALGVLFLITMKSDGHIDKSEIDKLKSNLSLWNNSNARKILLAVNQSEKAIESKNILDMFDNNDYFTDEVKSTVLSCIEFLKDSEYKGLRQIMYQQIMGLIKADGQIHENERWIRERMREIWNDAEI